MGWSTDPEENAIRYGILGVKGCGPVAASLIIEKRDYGGQYESVEELRHRCGSKVNKSRIEALTQAGAFDCFGARDDESGTQIALWEKERLGMTLTISQDTTRYSEIIRSNIYTQDEVAEAPKGQQVIIGGEVIKVEKKKTKKGQPFANATIAFEMNEWRVKFWSEQLERNRDLLTEGAVIMVAGSKDEWNGFVSVVAQNVSSIESVADQLKESHAA